MNNPSDRINEVPCPNCISLNGACFNCGGYGGFQVDNKPPYPDEWKVCQSCGGDGFCRTCGGLSVIEVEEVDTNELPLPFSHLPNDVEEWEDIL